MMTAQEETTLTSRELAALTIRGASARRLPCPPALSVFMAVLTACATCDLCHRHLADLTASPVLTARAGPDALGHQLGAVRLDTGPPDPGRAGPVQAGPGRGFNCRISSDLDDMERLHVRTGWTPGRESIR
jgi:hypothetical protein